jgi:predicted  nucleic acid-binding Zn-ribbon protein
MSTIGVVEGVSHQQTRPDLSLLLTAGPLSLLCTLCIALQREGNADLLVVILVGSLLCLKLRTRGLLYSLLLLLCGAAGKYLFFSSLNLWQLGIEASLFLGLFTISTASELHVQQKEDLSLHDASLEQTVQHLEEELHRTRKEAQEENITLRDRIAALQMELDETNSDLSALHILNDVLRQTHAKLSQDQELLNAEKNKLTEANLLLEQRVQEGHQLLQETRHKLFSLETKFQAITLERELQKGEPSFSPLEHDLMVADQECVALEQENVQLMELVALLSEFKRKKKEKKSEDLELFASIAQKDTCAT